MQLKLKSTTVLQKQLLVALICAVAFAWTSCEKDYHYIEPVVVPPPPDTTLAPISFNNSIQPIFTTNCAVSGCHDGNNYDPDLRSSFSRDALFNMGDIDTITPTNSILYHRITLPSADNDFMPQGGSPLSSTEINSILRW